MINELLLFLLLAGSGATLAATALGASCWLLLLVAVPALALLVVGVRKEQEK